MPPDSPSTASRLRRSHSKLWCSEVPPLLLLGNHIPQIKGNDACNNMVANICPKTPSTPELGLKGQDFFSESSPVAYQIKRIEE